MFLACATRRSGPYFNTCILLGLLAMSHSELRSEPVQTKDTIRRSTIHQHRKYAPTKAFTIIKIRSASNPSILPFASQKIGRVTLEKYSSHLDSASTSTDLDEHRQKAKLSDSGRASKTRQPLDPCKLSTCPLCKREHPRTSTRLKLPFHLFSP
jgi:hypothetical protein